jgi:LmbE family N-acetylglucosaminyl deacetylase
MNRIAAVVAAHPDDEVLGCGGTISRMAKEGYAVHILLMADGETARVSTEGTVDKKLLTARRTAAEEAGKILGCASVELLELPDNRLDGLGLLDVVLKIERFVVKHQPSTLFTHHSGDVNIDHRVVHDAVVVACRPVPNHSVEELLFFEVPSSTEWRPPGSAATFTPNWFVDISATLSKKKQALKVYDSEMRAFPHPRSLKAVEALAEWRGATAGIEAAEAFMLGRKITK